MVNYDGIFEGYSVTDFIAFLGHMRLAMLLNYDKGQNVDMSITQMFMKTF